MANTLLTSTWTLKEIGRGYENSIRFILNMTRKYGADFKVAGANVGNTINYRLPPLFAVSDGAALDVQNIQNRTVPIALTNQKHVDMSWSTWQEATELNTAQAETKAAGEALASNIDALAISTVYRDVYQTVGTLGTTPSTTALYLTANRKLTDVSVARAGRVAVLDPEAASLLAQATFTLFNPQAIVSENYRDGLLGRGQLGVSEWYEDQNRPTFTSGSATGASTPLINGASQTGTSVITDGWSTLVSKKGDIMTFGSVFTVNPLSKVSTGRLQQFATTVDLSDTAGDATFTVTPSIITSGAYQNVSASPANNAVITYWNMVAGGTFAATVSPTGMLFHPAAFAFVTADLARPNGGANVERISSAARGVALRMVEQYDSRTDQNITRIDTIVGAATLDARFAVRIQG